MESKIDWSKAPEGAMVLLKYVRDDSYAWAVSHSEDARAWHKWNIRCSFHLMASMWSVVAERPTTPSWSGEGLPPVGVVCEVRNAPGGWGKATIKYQGKGVTVWLWDRPDGNTDQIEFASCPDRLEFRPIRTPEQIAADERSKAIDEMVKALGMDDPGTAEYIRCGLIYDAGYRKEQK